MFRLGVAFGRKLVKAGLLQGVRRRRTLAKWAAREQLHLVSSAHATGESPDGTLIDAWLDEDAGAATLEAKTTWPFPKLVVR